MPLPTEAHKEVYERVGKFLRADWGDVNVEKSGDDSYKLWMGSTVVYVTIASFGREDPKPVVNVWAKTAIKIPYSSELAEYMVEENRSFIFGCFNFYPFDDGSGRGNLIFEVTVPGHGITREGLRDLVGAVGATSDYYDEQVVSKFGGQRAEDSAKASSGGQGDKELTGGDELWE